MRFIRQCRFHADGFNTANDPWCALHDYELEELDRRHQRELDLRSSLVEFLRGWGEPTTPRDLAENLDAPLHAVEEVVRKYPRYFTLRVQGGGHRITAVELHPHLTRRRQSWISETS